MAELSDRAKVFIDIPIDIETLESIARVEGCNYNNLDLWDASKYIKDRCIAYEQCIRED